MSRKQLQLHMDNVNGKGSHLWAECSFEIWRSLSLLPEPCYATLTPKTEEVYHPRVQAVSTERTEGSYFIVTRSN